MFGENDFLRPQIHRTNSHPAFEALLHIRKAILSNLKGDDRFEAQIKLDQIETTLKEWQSTLRKVHVKDSR